MSIPTEGGMPSTLPTMMPAPTPFPGPHEKPSGNVFKYFAEIFFAQMAVWDMLGLFRFFSAAGCLALEF